jgi:hypothetical protein
MSMATLIVLFGILIAGLSAWGMVAPQALTTMVLGTWRKPWGMVFAIAVRVLMAAIFIFAANETRFPGVFRIIGYVALLAAASIAVLGRERMDRFIGYWLGKPVAVMRAWLGFGVVFGLFCVYGAW